MENFNVFVLICAFALAIKFGIYDGLRELWYDHKHVDHKLRKPILFLNTNKKFLEKWKDIYFARKYTIAYWVFTFFVSSILLVDYFYYDGKL